MRSMYKVLCVASLAGLVAACGPQHPRRDQQNAQYQNPTTQTQLPAGRGGRLKRICADEIQKYCANEPKVRRCLRQNVNQLGATCKAAYDAAVERRRERKLERQTNGNQMNGAPATGNQTNSTPPQGQQHLLNNVRPNAKTDDDDDDN
jgi:hypothetical protein